MPASTPLRGLLLLSLSLCLLGPLPGCHSHRIPNPTGPAQPKTKKTAGNDAGQSADGQMSGAMQAERRTEHNSYDKNGILKKKKYARRRLTHKNGQHYFMGIIW